MDTHTPGKVPDWHNVPEAERNFFQRKAAETHGIVTPGNALTLAGYLVTKSGFNDIDKGSNILGGLKVMLGRLCDIGDGKLADFTGTKSEIGEAGDVISDAILMHDGLELMNRNDITPKTVGRTYKALGMMNTMSAAKAKSTGIEAHSSISGKLSTMKKWGSFVCYIAAKGLSETGHKKASERARKTGHAVSLGAIALGAYASYGYFKKAFPRQETNEAEEQPDAQYAESEGSSYSPADEEQHTPPPKD